MGNVESWSLARCLSESWVAFDRELRQKPLLSVIEDCLKIGNDPDAVKLLEDALAFKCSECYHDFDHWLERARENGWTVSLFSDMSTKSPDNDFNFIGFVCYHLKAPELHVDFLFVPPDFRGRGFGKRIVNWIINKAAHIPESQCRWITLSALDEKVPFYEKLGFWDMTAGHTFEGQDQTWMERQNMSCVAECNDVK